MLIVFIIIQLTVEVLWLRSYSIELMTKFVSHIYAQPVAARHHGLGGLSPPNKNMKEPNRGVARENKKNVPPIPGKLEN